MDRIELDNVVYTKKVSNKTVVLTEESNGFALWHTEGYNTPQPVSWDWDRNVAIEAAVSLVARLMEEDEKKRAALVTAKAAETQKPPAEPVTGQQEASQASA